MAHPEHEPDDCPELEGVICVCRIRPGTLQVVNGVLCASDVHGRLYVRAPRRADVALAQRVVATLKDHPLGEGLPELTAIREDG